MIDESCKFTQSIRISDYIMLSLLSLLSVPMLYITVKVKKLVWKRDKILPVMMTCLTTSILAFIGYYIFELISEYKLVWQNANSSSYVCCLSYFPYLPAFMLSLGIVLNLNKWIHYLLKILVFVKVENQIEALTNDNSNDSRMSSRISSRMSGTNTSYVSMTSVASVASK